MDKIMNITNKQQAWAFLRSLSPGEHEFDIDPVGRELVAEVARMYAAHYKRAMGLSSVMPVYATHSPGMSTKDGKVKPPGGLQVTISHEFEWIEFDVTDVRKSPVAEALDRLIETRQPQRLDCERSSINYVRVAASSRRMGIQVNETDTGVMLSFRDKDQRPISRIVDEAISRAVAEDITVSIEVPRGKVGYVRKIASEASKVYGLNINCCCTPIGVDITARRPNAVMDMLEHLKGLEFTRKLDLVELVNALGYHLGVGPLIIKENPLPPNEYTQERTGDPVKDTRMRANMSDMYQPDALVMDLADQVDRDMRQAIQDAGQDDEIL